MKLKEENERLLKERDEAVDAIKNRVEEMCGYYKEGMMSAFDSRMGVEIKTRQKAVEERDEALRLLATRVEAKRLDDAITERDEYRAKWLAVTNEYKPGWVQGLEAVARSVGYDPDKARHEGVEPPDFIQDVIERLQADNRYLRGSLSEIRSNIFQVLEERHEVYMLRHYLREARLAAHRALDKGRKVP
jgi:hypothetical protein